MMLAGAALMSMMAITGCAQRTSHSVGAAYGENGSGAYYLSAIRASSGLGQLQADPALEAAALRQARLMASAGRMAHTAVMGQSFASRMRSAGVEMGAENIAYGAFGNAGLFQLWMDSPPHRRNMLNPTFSRYGLASAQERGSSRKYWALVLAR